MRPGSNWRPQDLQSYALPLSYTPGVRAGSPYQKKKNYLWSRARRDGKEKIKKRSKLTGVGFEPTPPKRRELESPALDHSAIQPWPRRPRTAGQRTNERPTTAGRGRCVSVRYAVRPEEKKNPPARPARPRPPRPNSQPP